MKLYAVIQRPKRPGMLTGFVLMEAKSAKQAVELAAEKYPDHINSDDTDARKPVAELVWYGPGVQWERRAWML